MEKIIKPTRRAFRSDRPTISASHKSIFKFLCAFHAFLELVQPYTQLDDGHDQHDMIRYYYKNNNHNPLHTHTERKKNESLELSSSRHHPITPIKAIFENNKKYNSSYPDDIFKRKKIAFKTKLRQTKRKFYFFFLLLLSLHTLVQTKRKNPKADSTQRITWSSFIRPCVVTQHV